MQNLTGHDSPRCRMIPAYVDGILAGQLIPDWCCRDRSRDKRTIRAGGRRHALAISVAEQAYGHRDSSCARASILPCWFAAHQFSISGCLVIGGNAADAGFICIPLLQTPVVGPIVAPFVGSDARFVTNPTCTCDPGPHGQNTRCSFWTWPPVPSQWARRDGRRT